MVTTEDLGHIIHNELKEIDIQLRNHDFVELISNKHV